MSSDDRGSATVLDDRGSATVVAVGAMAVLVFVLVGGLHLGSAVIARHHGQSAADLAALAGAGSAVGGPEIACAEAARVVTGMDVALISCRTEGWDVLIEVRAEPGGPLGEFAAATARARAGPVR